MINEIVMGEIRELYRSFMNTNDYVEKSYIWYALRELTQLLPKNKEISKMYNYIKSKDYGLYDAIYEEYQTVQNFLQENSEFFDQNITLPKKFSKCSDKSLLDLPNENLFYIFGAFLDDLDNSVYKFYRKMVEEGRIFINSNSNHTMLTTLNNSNTIICIKEFKTLRDLMVLSHELGHAYYIYLNNQKVYARNIGNERFKSEIPSIVMEKKYIDFLYDNKIDDAALILQNEFDILMNIFYHKKNEFDSFKYLIGAYMAINNANKESITEYFKHIYKTDLKDLILEINNKEKVLKK